MNYNDINFNDFIEKEKKKHHNDFDNENSISVNPISNRKEELKQELKNLRNAKKNDNNIYNKKENFKTTIIKISNLGNQIWNSNYSKMKSTGFNEKIIDLKKNNYLSKSNYNSTFVKSFSNKKNTIIKPSQKKIILNKSFSHFSDNIFKKNSNFLDESSFIVKK